MASEQSFVDFVVDQLRDCEMIRARKMFGEYAIYSKGKLVALICENRFYVKPTAAGKEYIGVELVEAPPYNGAKNSFLIEDRIEDREWLCELVRITEAELPEPKPKKPKKIK